jgi:lipopolysaccharide biosynthesis glycosyltransferase
MLIRILLAVDPKQVIGCAVSMRSILENVRHGAAVHFDVITSGISPQDRQALCATVRGGRRQGTIDLHDVDLTRFTHLMASKLVSHTTYARLLIDDVLPPDAARCIYVDCDMVVERDIAEAWEFPLQGRTVAATANGDATDSRRNLARLGLEGDRYLNAGFVVIDVERWRALHVSERALQQAEMQGDRLVLHDQDALNCALQNDWVVMPREWNAGIPVCDWLTDDSKAVFHYWGAPKPWHADYTGRFRPKFFRYLDMTAFAGVRPWNPLGLGALLVRSRRRIPHYPSVVRAIKRLLKR